MNPKTFEYGGMNFYAKKTCKSCRYTPGFVTRTFPKKDGKKGKYVHKTLCHCVTEGKVPDANESVVPKVRSRGASYPNGTMHIKKKQEVQYASQAVPNL